MGQCAYLFPGQGSQFVGMGKDLYAASPAAKAVFDAADRALGFSLSGLCFEGPEEELKKTVNAQPALLTMSYACLMAAKEIVGDKMPNAAFAAGHSLGEYTALAAAESFDFTTAVRLARERGRLMYDAGMQVPGAMAAVIALDEETLRTVCNETGAYLANMNCPGQIVISGESAKVNAASRLAKQRGAKLTLPLQVSGAFHSPLMAPAVENMDKLLAAAQIRDPVIPVVGNTQAQVLRTSAEVRTELRDQLCGCVQWQKTVEYLLAQGITEFIEIGPGKVLTGLVKRITKEAETTNLADLESICTYAVRKK